jgi:hypothetical protein
VNRYTAKAVGPLQDPNLLALLPTSLPKATLLSLAPLLPSQLRAQLAPLVPRLPDRVQLSYIATTTVGVWADKRIGLPLDETIDQQVVVSIAGPAPVSLIPVLAVKAEITPDRISCLAHKAAKAASALMLISVILPLVALFLGLLAIVGAVLLARRRPASSSPADATGAMSRLGAG